MYKKLNMSQPIFSLALKLKEGFQKWYSAPQLEFFRQIFTSNLSNFILYICNGNRKFIHHRLTDHFQTLMGTSGHHNGHFDIK